MTRMSSSFDIFVFYDLFDARLFDALSNISKIHDFVHLPGSLEASLISRSSFFFAAKLCSLYRFGTENRQGAGSGLCVDQSGQEVDGAGRIC